jgi:hypothetical protein
MDAGQRLTADLNTRGYSCELSHHLAALPTITPTAKPALLATSQSVTGEGSSEMVPLTVKSKTALTADAFRKLLAESGYQVLKEDEYGDATGIAWTETGAVDAYGHQHQWKVAHHLQGELDIIKNRLMSLLERGWKQVLVVTDHGWLLLPGGLPKAELPEHLTSVRKGRCARLKEGTQTDYLTVPWQWDNQARIAVAPGIRCFEAGKEFEHGGLSPQECVVPVIRVSPLADRLPPTVTIQDVSWKGLRCSAWVMGGASDFEVDLRAKAGDPATSLVTSSKNPSEDGYVSLLVVNEDQIGESAYLVVSAPDGQLRAQLRVTIGG